MFRVLRRPWFFVRCIRCRRSTWKYGNTMWFHWWDSGHFDDVV